MIITKIDEHTEQVSYLICMMKYTRNITLASVQGLNQRQLDSFILNFIDGGFVSKYLRKME